MSNVVRLKMVKVFSITDCEVDFIQEPGGSPETDKEAMTQHGLVWPDRCVPCMSQFSAIKHCAIRQGADYCLHYQLSDRCGFYNQVIRDVLLAERRLNMDRLRDWWRSLLILVT